MKIIKSATLDSIEATIIDVEATFTKGMPSFTIVGMVSASINESKDRIKSSLLLNNFKFPMFNFQTISNVLMLNMLHVLSLRGVAS